MIDEVIVYTRPDGGITVVHPAPKGHGTVEDAPARVERRVRTYRTVFDKDGNRIDLKAPQDVVVPATRRKETDAELLQRILRESVPADARNVRVVQKSRLPADRTFRDAWRQEGARVEVDMEKARGIHRAEIRRRRKPMLEELDREYIRADEVRDTAERERIIALKNKLRDAPADPRIDAAETPDALKAVDPLAG